MSKLKSLLRVKNLSAGYANRLEFKSVLKSISLTVAEGQSIGLVGESGSGKTTLIDAILGLLPFKGASQTTGAIDCQGEIGKEITYIPQDPARAFDPLFTIEENFTEILGVREDKKIQAALKRAGFHQEINLASYPHQLSGGMKQRILIALALITNPKLIIADEPTSNLDVTLRAEILELFKTLKQNEKSAFVLATHDLALAELFCDTIYVIYKGRIVESGKTESIFKHPQHTYTKELMGVINA